MSGLLRAFILGDLGNWLHTSELEERTDTLAGRLDLKRKLDEEQSQSIIELELAFAGLIGLLQKKGLLTNGEINTLIQNAENEAKDVIRLKNRLLNPTIRD